MQFLGIRVLLKRIKAIRFMMADKTVTYRSYTADLVSDRLDR